MKGSEHMTVEVRCENPEERAAVLEVFNRIVESRHCWSVKKFQAEVAEWARKNFGPLNPDQSILGIAEEVGELLAAQRNASKAGFAYAEHIQNSINRAVEAVGKLCHSHLKRAQGIRGTALEHNNEGMDAVGDIVVYLANYCAGMGWDLEDCVVSTWDKVKQRDWTKDKLEGLDFACLTPIDTEREVEAPSNPEPFVAQSVGRDHPVTYYCGDRDHQHVRKCMINPNSDAEVPYHHPPGEVAMSKEYRVNEKVRQEKRLAALLRADRDDEK